jgi:hypothetical protein
MAGKREGRVYAKRGRFYADFRDFADVGGRQEALRLRGERSATTDRDVAAKLAADRLEELRAARAAQSQAATDRLFGIEPREAVRLAPYAARHLTLKAQDGEVVRSWLGQSQKHLETAVAYFGAGAELDTLTPRHMTA